MTPDQLKNIADAAGLPEALADRLRGDTPEEVAKDAAALVEALPPACRLEPRAAAKAADDAEYARFFPNH